MNMHCLVAARKQISDIRAIVRQQPITTIEILLEAVFSVGSFARLYSEDLRPAEWVHLSVESPAVKRMLSLVWNGSQPGAQLLCGLQFCWALQGELRRDGDPLLLSSTRGTEKRWRSSSVKLYKGDWEEMAIQFCWALQGGLRRDGDPV
jgi:hypothetical protein